MDRKHFIVAGPLLILGAHAVPDRGWFTKVVRVALLGGGTAVTIVGALDAYQRRA